MATTVSSTSSNPGASILASPGIGSGLDVNSIVSQLMQVAQQPITQLDTQEGSYQTELTAWGGIKSALSTFQTAVEGLNNVSQFQLATASVADSTVASATSTGNATPGNYALSVSQLAQAQKIYSGGFSSSTATVGSGTLTFQFGSFDGTSFTPNTTAGSKTVTIPSGQDTLAGIRDAVNAANIGVSATIVNDGSANGNRLVFTSTNSGAANGLKITTTDDDGNNTDAAGLSQLAYDPAATAGAGKNMTQALAAQDAKFTIDGIAFSKPSNTVTDAVQGVTLNLLGTSATSGSGATATTASTTLTVAHDNASITKNVQSFVTAYNTLQSTLAQATSYDASTQTAGPLLGDAGVSLIQNQLVSIIGSGGTNGAPGTLTNLTQIGITFQQDGTLALDTTKLDNALSSNFAQIGGLFAKTGYASDGQIQFVSSGAAAQSGSYPVQVTALATQGTLTGQSAAGLTITAGVNDTLTMSIDGNAATVTLTPGTYASADALAAQVQAQVNGNATLSAAGSAVTVTQNGGVLSVTSNRYGSASTVSFGGNAASNLFGSGPTATAGTDVAGTINGLPATGSGQVLSGLAGSAVDDVKLTVSGGTTGARGNVTISAGFAGQLDSQLTSLLSSNGPVSASTDGINRSITDINNQITDQNTHLAALQAQYTAEFSSLDSLISSMNSTSTFLTQQLATLTGITS